MVKSGSHDSSPHAGEKLKTLLYRARYCLTCKKIIKDGPNHNRKRKDTDHIPHEMRGLSAAEKQELERNWHDVEVRGQEA